MAGIVYPEPIRSFRFLIRVDGGISAAFTDCSSLKTEMETLQARTGADLRGVRDYTPVLTRYAPVTLRRGVVGDCDFFDWVCSASAGSNTGPTGKDLRRTVEIVTINDQGLPGVVWTLTGAMPVGYEVSPLDGGRSEVLTESLTLVYTGLQRRTEAYKAAVSGREL